MKKKIKNRVFIVIITLVIGTGLGVYAANTYQASEVIYNPSNGEPTNVNDALNELYKNINIGGCTSNVAPPEIKGNLIPITISNDGIVKYADTSKKWYNYCNKEWANAVILEDDKTYKVGDTIPESAIESYFVWIPRYRYKLWNTGTAIKNAHSIEIEFETKETTPSTGDENGEWLTHPAFTSFNTNGFWVGKFETGYKGATSKTEAQKNENNSSKVIIKPNVYSWRSITVYNMFLTSYNYERELDSHMMKNTEWGAVAYLSHSKYGIGTEVNINNNSSYKTGYSALPRTKVISLNTEISGDSEQYNMPYNTEIGYQASTTGNITGVYDMRGGTQEYVAGYVSGKMGSSGFTTTTISEYDSKYFDVYNASSSITTYQYRILGDATGEMGPFISFTYTDTGSWTEYRGSWYEDTSQFVDSSYPWFYRGGPKSRYILSGQFNFSRNNGSSNGGNGFRLVLAP